MIRQLEVSEAQALFDLWIEGLEAFPFVFCARLTKAERKTLRALQRGWPLASIGVLSIRMNWSVMHVCKASPWRGKSTWQISVPFMSAQPCKGAALGGPCARR